MVKSNVLKRTCNHIGLAFGIIGLIIFMVGLLTSVIATKNQVILVATIFLASSAWIQREPFFMGSQTIALISAILVYLLMPAWVNLSALIVLSILFAMIFFRYHPLSFDRIIAFSGLIALCLGIVLGNNIPMLVAGILLAIYAIFSIRHGYSVGWVFLILNILFGLVAGYALIA